MTKDTIMLFQGSNPHPAHKAFGDALDADYLHFETGQSPNGTNQDSDSELSRLVTGLKLPRGYDIAIAEGSAPLQTLFVLGLVSPDTTTVFLAADETFYDLSNRPTRYLWTGLTPLLRRTLDGVVAISDDVIDSVSAIVGPTATRKVYPPISDQKYDDLLELEPSSLADDGVRLLTAGTVKPANNHAMLVSTAEQLRRDRDADVSVTILGSGHSEMEYATPNWVTTPGFVNIDTFVDHFRKASVYVQPSSGDGFSVAAAEGMLSGTPTIVTTGVGARELIDPELVAPLNRAGFAAVITSVLDRSESERNRIGKRQRKAVTGLTEKNQRAEFKSAIEDFDND